MGWQLASLSLTHISLSLIQIRDSFQLPKHLGHIYTAAFCLLNRLVWRKSCFINTPWIANASREQLAQCPGSFGCTCSRAQSSWQCFLQCAGRWDQRVLEPPHCLMTLCSVTTAGNYRPCHLFRIFKRIKFLHWWDLHVKWYSLGNNYEIRPSLCFKARLISICIRNHCLPTPGNTLWWLRWCFCSWSLSQTQVSWSSKTCDLPLNRRPILWVTSALLWFGGDYRTG